MQQISTMWVGFTTKIKCLTKKENHLPFRYECWVKKLRLCTMMPVLLYYTNDVTISVTVCNASTRSLTAITEFSAQPALVCGVYCVQRILATSKYFNIVKKGDILVFDIQSQYRKQKNTRLHVVILLQDILNFHIITF